MHTHHSSPRTAPPRRLTAPDRTTVYLPSPQRLLGVWAHPDDEAYLSAGLMDRVVRSGGQVTVVALTDGEAGFPDDDRRSIAVRRAVRRTELRAAMAEIGVSDVRFLGLPDGAVADADSAEIASQIAEIMADVRPDVTVTFGPDGITGHDDHVACCRLASRAWRSEPIGRLWYAAKTVDWLDEWRTLHERIGLWMTAEPAGVRDTEVESRIRLSSRELDTKRTVLAAHASQTGGVAAVFGEQAYRRWIGEEAFRSPEQDELDAVAGRHVLVGAAAS